MKALLHAILNLIAVNLALSQNNGFRGFIRNVQVADGSSFPFSGLSAQSRETEIPIELLFRMSSINDTREFIENFVYTGDRNVTLSQISSAFGHEVIERRAVGMAIRMASCQPELKTVSIQPDDRSNVLYHPSCIRVERCGGCCIHNLLSCTAVESEILNVPVVVLEYTGGAKMNLKESILVTVEKHTKCRCLCRTQPEDCKKLQRYNRNTCSCDCRNPDVERKCRENSANRIWNKDTCSCVCKEELECSTGLYYDPVSCRCEYQDGRTRQSERPWIA